MGFTCYLPHCMTTSHKPPDKGCGPSWWSKSLPTVDVLKEEDGGDSP